MQRNSKLNRTEFVIATAIILFAAFCMGWFANWLAHRLSRVRQSDVADLDRMSQELHEAEETRDQAITYLQQREAELTNQLTQTEAELSAAMDGLRAARQEAEELRGRLTGMIVWTYSETVAEEDRERRLMSIDLAPSAD